MRRNLVILKIVLVLFVSGCSAAQPDLVAGEGLAASKGCLACHAVDATVKIGPSWAGLYGSTVTLSDGSTLTADEKYLEESIINPNAKIVQGYSTYSMPAINLAPDETESLIVYIKALR